MKLYRAKVPTIASEIIATLVRDGDIDVPHEMFEEAEKDLIAIMDEFMRRDAEFRDSIKDHMADAGLAYSEFGRVRSKLAEELNHPLNNDVERFLARQFTENMMISRFVDEVFEEDRVIYKKILEIIASHHVDEEGIREEAKDKVKNVTEGTVDYEIAMQKAVKEVKKRRGLL